MTATYGDAAVQAFLAVAADLGGRQEWDQPELAAALGLPLTKRPGESSTSYRVYAGSGRFAGAEVAAELRAPRRRRKGSPLLLVLQPVASLPLSEGFLAACGQPDVLMPPGPHADPPGEDEDNPEYLGFRRGAALASLGLAGGRLVSLVLQVPG